RSRRFFPRNFRTCSSTAPAASRSAWPPIYPRTISAGASRPASGLSRTHTPPHKLGAVIDACVALIDNPSLSIDELINIVPGPDFPTGGIILGRQGIRSAYHLGRGSIGVRGKGTTATT